jgi:protein-S-isoprenylcysteine O-methyltransferase Ste14
LAKDKKTVNALELKIPPVALVVLIAVVMWGASDTVPQIGLDQTVRMVVGVVMLISGAGISLYAVTLFRRAKTTVDPTRPHASSSLVSTGIYRHTRNPMYLGFLLILISLAVFLATPLALFGPVIFVLYMNRFQITPEERFLAKQFGEEFLNYKSKVRRWC